MIERGLIVLVPRSEWGNHLGLRNGRVRIRPRPWGPRMHFFRARARAEMTRARRASLISKPDGGSSFRQPQIFLTRSDVPDDKGGKNRTLLSKFSQDISGERKGR